MVALLLFILFGLIFGYFATLNTAAVSVYFGTYALEQIPMYIVVLTSFAIGVLFASLFHFARSLQTANTIGKLEKELSEAKKETLETTRKNHQLELENTRLKVQNGEESEDADSL